MRSENRLEWDTRFFDGLDGPQTRALVRAFSVAPFRKAGHLARQGDPDDREYLLVSGKAVSLIGDAEGREICVGFFVAPCVITPNLARIADGISLVTLRAETDGQVASMPAETLLAMMRESPAIEAWANAILRAELARKTSREWSLAALGAKERLDWFRGLCPDHEALFNHGLIASFLGMTPVTLSRLRNPGKP